MPVSGTIEARAVVLRFEGQYDNRDLERALQDLAPGAEGRPLLIDASATGLYPGPAETEERLEVIRRFMPPLRPRIALVVADARRYTIAKVVQLQAEQKGMELHVFGAWQVQSARLWLEQGGGAPAGPALPRTVLVVEDDDSMRAVAHEVLEEEGYKVLEARTGAEALEVAVLNRGAIDLLLTDLMMPVMNGRELAREFQGLYPECRILFFTGYGATELVQGGVLAADTLVLQKPFTPETLLGTVRRALIRPR